MGASLLINHAACKGSLAVSPTMFSSLLSLSSEDTIYSPQKSSRAQLDHVQLCRNQRGESQPSCFSVKENVRPGEFGQPKRRPCQTRAPNETEQLKGNCSVTRHPCIVPGGARKEASGHFCACLSGCFSSQKSGFAAGQQLSPSLAEPLPWAKHKECGKIVLSRFKNKQNQFHPPWSVFANFSPLVGTPTPSLSVSWLSAVQVLSSGLVCPLLFLVSMPASFPDITLPLKIGSESYFYPLSRDRSSQTPTGCRNEFKTNPEEERGKRAWLSPRSLF